MTAYADYAFYTDKYLGRAIPNENDFAYYALRASEIIDSKTFGRIDEITPAVRMACCAAADELYSDASARAKAAGGVSSESVDGYSVSYRAYNTESEKAAKKRVNAAIKLYLGGTGLMFRGCG
ncbi:MAG: DnaT-like ssDNA-binding protein [Oscillospiraceae bacterium]